MARSLRPAGPLAALAAVLLLAACGEKTVKADELNQSIGRQFKAQGVAVHDVSCPGDIKARVGTRFTCTAFNAAGAKLVIAGRVVTVRGDRVNTHFQTAYALVSGAKIAARARAGLEQRVGQKAKGMTCPKTIRIPTQPTVTCKLTTLDGMTFDTKVRVDSQGRLQAEVAKQPSSGG